MRTVIYSAIANILRLIAVVTGAVLTITLIQHYTTFSLRSELIIRILADIQGWIDGLLFNFTLTLKIGSFEITESEKNAYRITSVLFALPFASYMVRAASSSVPPPGEGAGPAIKATIGAMFEASLQVIRIFIVFLLFLCGGVVFLLFPTGPSTSFQGFCNTQVAAGVFSFIVIFLSFGVSLAEYEDNKIGRFTFKDFFLGRIAALGRWVLVLVQQGAAAVCIILADFAVAALT